ncbi:MAG: apolipoprotein N-acyltransferase [Nitrospinaceae bacterium]|nr:apolipoprotein N-acyltransferase [Nitrospinaceae bacterium]
MVFYFISMSWVINTLVNYGHIPEVLSWLILTLLVCYMSAFLGLFTYLVRRFCKGNPVYIFLLAPAAWTALEYLRSSHSIYGFSWQGLGYSQFLFLPVIQMASFTGVYGVSALIVLVNAGLFVMLHPECNKYPVWRNYTRRIGVITLLVMVLCTGYGGWVLKDTPPQTSQPLKIGLIQGNIPQQMKWDPAYKAETLRRYRKLTLEAAKFRPDLMVWPEAVTPFYFGRDIAGTAFVRDVVLDAGVPLVLGSPAVDKIQNNSAGMETESYRLYNSAYLLGKDGRPQGRYDKIHLVPFGEFVPFRSILFFVDKLVEGGIGDFNRGHDAKLFSVAGYGFAVSICFEIIFPDLVRQPVKNGANYLVNITNDAWFGRSAASEQHMSMVAMRAVENRVPIVRAANTGITGTIDPYGRIIDATPLFQDAWVIAQIHPTQTPPGFYSTYGDVFSGVCLLLTPLLALMGVRSKTPSSFGWV